MAQPPADFDLVLTDPAAIRARRTTSQEVLAGKVGVSTRTLQYMEGNLKNGKRVRVSYYIVQALADFFECSPNILVQKASLEEHHDVSNLERGGRTSDAITPVISINEFHQRFNATNNEYSFIKTRAILLELLRDTRPLLNRDERPGLARLVSRSLSRLADITTEYETRIQYRRECIDVLQAYYDKYRNPLDLVSLGNRTVDHFYEGVGRGGYKWIINKIVKTKRELRDVSFSMEESDGSIDLIVLLITQSSSLLRCQAKIDDGEVRHNRLITMIRCADKAQYLAPDNSVALLECGQARWFLAFGHDAESSRANLQIAEKLLLKASQMGFNLANLVLARFYRQNYYPANSVLAFRQFAEHEKDAHFVLAETHLLGEAAWQLWKQKEPDAVTQVNYARKLLVGAIESGYCDTRKILALAFVEAILFGVESGTGVIAKLKQGTTAAWTYMLETAMRHVKNGNMDELRRAFVFGLDQGVHWNSLGTFVTEFVGDNDLSLKLYDTGLMLSPRDHVLWLNKARLVKKSGDKSTYTYCIKNARQYSTPPFVKFIDEVEDG